MKLWQIVAVVAAGVAYGFVQPGRLAHALGHSMLYVFLPALLYEAAWNLNYRAMRRQWAAIATLAGPGVLLSAAIVAGALVLAHVGWGPALLAGAILSATDPIAVVAVFRRIKIPTTLVTIVQCESLFNDAVAVALYRALLVTLSLGAASAATIAAATIGALLSSAGGVLLGVVLAFVVAQLLRGKDAVRLQIAATVVCAYGSYFGAEYLKLSGIFATIASGIALHYFERSWITLRIAEGVDRFWDVVAVLANIAVFFMVGAALEIGRLAHEPLFTVACLAAVALSRFAVAELLRPWPYPREWVAVVRVAGMRGALSLALALAIPAWVPHREAIIEATFAVTLATLAGASLTVRRVVQRAVSPG